MNNNLGMTLKLRRKIRGLTLVQLANLSGMSPAFIARVERGERLPSGLYLRKFAKPLGFSEVELLKLAGFVSEDTATDVDELKERVKKQIVEVLANLCDKIDRL